VPSDLDRRVQVGGFDQVVAAERLLRLDERPVSDGVTARTVGLQAGGGGRGL